MDTNDLSKETYEAVILTSERFHEDLASYFGCMAMQCEDDDEYLDAIESTITGWQIAFRKDFDFLIEELFMDCLPEAEDFKNILNRILKNIENVKNIPLNDRNFEF